MTQEEKQLLLTDLCARLPYGVKIYIDSEFLKEKSLDVQTLISVDFSLMIVLAEHNWYIPEKIKPYLRPMSSMTKEERAEMGTAIQKDRIEPYGEIKNFGEDNLLLCTIRQSTNLQDWLNANHFDYRGLIPMGLALEAPEGMYGENC